MGLKLLSAGYIYIYIYIVSPGAGAPSAPWGNLSELEIVKFKQLDGAGAPSSCLNLTTSSERPLGSPRFPWGEFISIGPNRTDEAQ